MKKAIFLRCLAILSIGLLLFGAIAIPALSRLFAQQTEQQLHSSLLLLGELFQPQEVFLYKPHPFPRYWNKRGSLSSQAPAIFWRIHMFRKKNGRTKASMQKFRLRSEVKPELPAIFLFRKTAIWYMQPCRLTAAICCVLHSLPPYFFN